MNRAKVKKPPTHYLLVGSAVVGEGSLDRDSNTIVLRLAKGTNLNWRGRKKLRLLATFRTAIEPPRPIESIA
jgi:hypothetical protein